MKNIENINLVMKKIGAKSSYKGYYLVAEAIEISLNSEEKPIRITKDIYPRLARKFHSSTRNIEHNIRTLICACWTTNKKNIEEIAGYTLKYKPTNSEFVDMLVRWVTSQDV